MSSDFEKSAFGKYCYPSNNKKPILIYGIGELARMAYQYFSEDSPYTVAGFISDKEYLPKDKSAFGLEITDAEQIGFKILPEDYQIFVAFSGANLSYPRSNKVTELASLGFTLPSYVSSYAFLASDARIGTNVMIFEHNTIQSEVKIEDSAIIWSGNHIGHQSRIGVGCFLSSHVCIGGRTEVGNNSYLGMNSTVRDQLVIGPNSVIGANSYVSKDFPGNGVAFGSPAKLIPSIDPFKAIN
jgi:sugar O-acyltransferase (sialic acid O-acetyltransferase NeuD family)